MLIFRGLVGFDGGEFVCVRTKMFDWMGVMGLGDGVADNKATFDL